MAKPPNQSINQSINQRNPSTIQSYPLPPPSPIQVSALDFRNVTHPVFPPSGMLCASVESVELLSFPVHSVTFL